MAMNANGVSPVLLQALMRRMLAGRQGGAGAAQPGQPPLGLDINSGMPPGMLGLDLRGGGAPGGGMPMPGMMGAGGMPPGGEDLGLDISAPPPKELAPGGDPLAAQGYGPPTPGFPRDEAEVNQAYEDVDFGLPPEVTGRGSPALQAASKRRKALSEKKGGKDSGKKAPPKKK